MNNDALRAECEEFLATEYPIALVNGQFLDEDIEALMGFARAQQAKGLREAAKTCDQQVTFLNQTGCDSGIIIGAKSCATLVTAQAKKMDSQL